MVYSGEHLKEIVFPLGGIGTGSIGLAGNGSFVDWEIFNRPNKGSLNNYSFFVVKAEYSDGTSKIKVLHGDWDKDLMGKYSQTVLSGYGYGPHTTTMSGFPHFKKVKFDGKFPIAKLTFEDDGFPAQVIMEAFNPLIPLDSDKSSIPAAFFEIKIKSFEDDVKYSVLLSVFNPFESTQNSRVESEKYTAVKMVCAGKETTEKDYGDMTIAVDCSEGICQEYWYRGGGQYRVKTFWKELTEGHLEDRKYEGPSKGDIGTVGASAVIHKKQNQKFRFILSWNVPNNYNYWNAYKDDDGNDITWKNYYAKLFGDSTESAFYALDQWNELYTKTKRFCTSMHSATIDKTVVDAMASALAVLKSSTVLRLENGALYGWEGVNELEGSCEGTCTHVWSYAYALCFLFPDLERSLRETEFAYDTDENGRMYFRTALPLGRGYVEQPPCVDGQMSTIIKIYRDWKLTGDGEWIKDNWENIKKVLEYAWNENNTYEWDKNKDGVLEGWQHHTLDVEIFGPTSWLQGLYLAALKAAKEMAEFLGDTQKATEYGELFQKGYIWTKENLFNGKYFYQNIDLKNREYADHFKCPNYWDARHGELRHQIGEGCAIDQLLGQWHANICGLGDIFDKEQRQIALQHMMKNNFKSTFRDFLNTCRVYALNDEAGAIICDYPDGVFKPDSPIPYREECMTGFEYAFAGLLISEGMMEDGLRVVRAIRERYDGKKRNPWNEIECGSNYARAMASFALLPIFSGFEFDVPNRHIGFSPLCKGDFKCMWNLGCAWGDFVKKDNNYEIRILDGEMELKSISLEENVVVQSVYVDNNPIPFVQEGRVVSFEEVKVKKHVKIERE